MNAVMALFQGAYAALISTITPPLTVSIVCGIRSAVAVVWSDWQTYFVWPLLHQALFNTYVAYCKVKEERLPLKDVVADIVAGFVGHILPPPASIK